MVSERGAHGGVLPAHLALVSHLEELLGHVAPTLCLAVEQELVVGPVRAHH